MLNRAIAVLALLGCGVWSSGLQGADPRPADQAGEVLFARDIQPLLAKHCLLCHGPDDAEAGLRLDQSDNARAELDSGERAIVPGDPDSSELLRRVTASDESMRMPPDEPALSAAEVQLLRDWIREAPTTRGIGHTERLPIRRCRPCGRRIGCATRWISSCWLDWSNCIWPRLPRPIVPR